MKSQAKGLGLRQEFVDLLCEGPKLDGIDFLELSPENWLGLGGKKRDQLEKIADRYPLVAHGLSLSIADTQPLNQQFLEDVREFLDDYRIQIYSDHLSLSRDRNGYLYDLLPTPRYQENIAYLVDRIRCVQDVMQRRLVLENISYYHAYPKQLPEGEFLANVAERSGCGILLDINNVYVNGRNHGTDPREVIAAIPSSAIVYYHIAGHQEQEDGLLLDTHGTTVCNQVLSLVRQVIDLHGPRPLVLERDHNVPPLPYLAAELDRVYEAIRGGSRAS